MYLQNLKIAIIFSVTILSINSISALQIPSSNASDQTQSIYLGNLSRNINTLNSNTAIRVLGMAGNSSRIIDESAFMQTQLDIHSGIGGCGGWYVFMKICGFKNKVDEGKCWARLTGNLK